MAVRPELMSYYKKKAQKIEELRQELYHLKEEDKDYTEIYNELNEAINIVTILLTYCKSK